MKYLGLAIITLAITFSGCSSDTKSTTAKDSLTDTITHATPNAADKTATTKKHPDEVEIRALIVTTLNWANSEHVVGLLPAIVKDSICIGFDLNKVNQTAEALKKTGLFADEFTENYKHIMQTLDEKIRSNKFEKWNVSELPTFTFANDVNPWCSCQDNYSWENVDIADLKINGNKATANWNWGKLPDNVDPSWKKFAMPFRAVKEGDQWKIAYLNGFDYKESVQMLPLSSK
ncbi:hypothetical protein [Mucilaginibacter myungsuensis]|uniref:Uncharacterized protein n=1 Tax=Mucilaginibacter myungsuensis TaxID=649104 RepID=A0A929KYP6_9SPHI|nr:hypothetical protein [Mucilaginibacter myungsuensis]MBE9664121.1 hypothetical protein [Mucilaginibacter myungsuensis]MDN3601300.1 hypothetical protein [Mucilaginibacter myungsuensis]